MQAKLSKQIVSTWQRCQKKKTVMVVKPISMDIDTLKKKKIKIHFSPTLTSMKN